MKLNIGDIVVEYFEDNHLATFVTIDNEPETETRFSAIVLKNVDTGKLWKVPSLKHYGGNRFKVIRSPCKIKISADLK